MELAELDAHRASVTTSHGPLSYVDVGQGPVALFVHGVGTNAALWRGVIGAVADMRRCIALDLPLHGRSPAAPGQDFSLGALADVVAAFCDALDLTSVDLVANDTGGAIAQIFAARHPGRLRTFTLTNCDTHDNIPPEAFKPTVELAEAGVIAQTGPRLASDPGLLRAGAIGAGYEHPDRIGDEVLRYYAEPVLGTAETARAFERLLTELKPDDLVAAEPALRELRAPTLVVWGTGDQFFDVKWAYWLRDTIPGVTEVVEVPGGKLFFPDERPGDLVPHLRRHWDAHPA
ncbi:alpha/beta hydrolase [Actinomadura sp. NPDC047616]|uniref:alpha/beta fold hydrolase n=1 Tax=Actinomadura sp. NPDC047616 TaxID=3155914 RepID=UPI0034036A28